MEAIVPESKGNIQLTTTGKLLKVTIKCDLKNEEDLKNWEYLKNEYDIKNKDNLI